MVQDSSTPTGSTPAANRPMGSSIDWARCGLGTGTLASLGRALPLAGVRRLLDTMLELGMPTIDTADSYGSGDCECLLAKAMAGRREQFNLVTKAGYRHGNLGGPLRPLNQFIKKGLQRMGKHRCFESSYLERCIHHSLKRLKTDRVEAFLLHDPPLDVIQSGSVEALFAKIKKQGSALHTGISSGDPEVLAAALERGLCDVIQSPAGLSAAGALGGVWALCESRSIHVIGNHVFEPSLLNDPSLTHERLMKASASLLPKSATILCGTGNPNHFRSTLAWIMDPMPREEAWRLAAGHR
ncbi:MAG: aldo/keto reductase [Armatimonadetes bacterium]|nr:aldo/keto reductase [Akkermansiaceae bacterium]